jgi:stearoyl-CoA desaturase (Delta-9 desaturase)
MWMIAFGNILGLSSVAIGMYLITLGSVSAQWLLLWPIFHLLGSVMSTVGLHRYFSHAAFKTTPFWNWVMSLYSVILLNGSAIGWAAAHTTHHVHADTDRDPHFKGISYLLYKRYKDVPMCMKMVKVLSRNKAAMFTHRYGMPLWILFFVGLGAVSWKLLLFAYLMPLGTIHLIGGVHNTFSHTGDRPRNFPFLEFILPASGEWMHAVHHENPGRSDMRKKWWHLDLGYLFIKAIRTDKPQKDKQ